MGIISDIHDNLPMLDKAIALLNSENVEMVLCAGDYIAPFVTSHFEKLNTRMVGVFGNNDAERQILRDRFRDMGFDVGGVFKSVKISSLNVALLHGHDRELLESLIKFSSFDLIVHGHTHKAGVVEEEKLVISPGEVCGYLSGKPTIAIFDTEARKARILNII